MIKVSIEASDTLDAEEKILAMADDIRERRALVADGCTCDQRLPKTRRTDFGPDGVGPGVAQALRCHGPWAVCEARKAKTPKVGCFHVADAVSQFVRLSGGSDGNSSAS